MPFTISHAAALIPLKRWNVKVSTTAFVVGSVVPDFENFLLLRHTDKFAHTLPGVFLFDFPAALFFCFAFHLLLKSLVIDILPNYYRSRLEPYRNFNWPEFCYENVVLVIRSIFMGIVIHMFLDGFTHDHGIFIQALPILRYNIPWLDHKPVFFILQIILSFLGIVLLQWYVSKMPSLPVVNRCASVRYDIYLLPILAFFVLMVRVLVNPYYNSTTDLLKACIGAFIYAVFIVSIRRHIIKKKYIW
ncbi:MAG: DUF4184 family protein [Bacteroidia bacterium]|nr:DUF4184 family protein [Bacteroidia bacterium]